MLSNLRKATVIAAFGAAYVSIVGATLLLHATLICFAGPRSAPSKRAEP